MKIGLFVTCLVDLLRPAIGFAAIKLLQDAGCEVEVPAAQTCCGQPGYNNGDNKTAIKIARQVIECFAPYDYVVAPSGSCAAMIRLHYPPLFPEHDRVHQQARALAEKTYELTQFLHDILGLENLAVFETQTITYHDGCSGLRELGIRHQPRALLGQAAALKELADPEACCGFGGTFCVKYPDISNDMVVKKTADIEATGAALVLGGDLGCLLNIAGKLSRDEKNISVRHISEVLAGTSDVPPIGKPGGL